MFLSSKMFVLFDMFDLDVKGGKDGNPQDLATIFFETRKKDNKLVEQKEIEKHVCWIN